MNAQPPLRVRSRTIPAGTTARLRLMCTTDLHAHLLPYDYYADEGGRPYGLSRVATLIRAARAETANTLLFDNGDALQGAPVGDMTGPAGSGWTGPNPVIVAMNRLRYDAATLGNHDFNLGLDWLEHTLSEAAFPLTCANVRRCTSGDIFLPPDLMLRRWIADDTGRPRLIRIGVIGLVPPQIAIWDRAHLRGRLEACDMVEAARLRVAALRGRGADVVLLLAHTGIDAGPPGPLMENAALPLAALPGVDAIMAGHSHGVFPRPGAAGGNGVDHARGMISGTPALMAGSRGSHLGVLDLGLTWRAGRWSVTRHRSEARAVAPCRAGGPATPSDTDLDRSAQAAHAATLRHMRRPVGRSAERLHSYLALLRPDASVAAVNAVQARLMARALAGGPHAHLPILSATPAFKTGGRGGPQNFTDVPHGALSLRHAADLCPFANRLCGIVVTGADLRAWLERAAICFARQVPGSPAALLCDPTIPGHDFDVIAGLRYQIDLSAPARHDRRGAVIAPGAHRIRDLRHDGLPVIDSDRFVLATNTYRVQGGGAFIPATGAEPVHVSDMTLRDALSHEIARRPLAAPPGYKDAWRFAPMPGTSVLLDTSPALRDIPGALDGLNAEGLGITADGFWRLRVAL